MITPLLFMFSTSLKPASDVYDLRLIPANPTFSNYIEVFVEHRLFTLVLQFHGWLP